MGFCWDKLSSLVHYITQLLVISSPDNPFVIQVEVNGVSTIKVNWFRQIPLLVPLFGQDVGPYRVRCTILICRYQNDKPPRRKTVYGW